MSQTKLGSINGVNKFQDANGNINESKSNTLADLQATTVAALAATTNLTAVPGSFADLAAVQTYLAGANMVPNIETRLDNLEAKVNAVIAALKTAGLMA